MPYMPQRGTVAGRRGHSPWLQPSPAGGVLTTMDTPTARPERPAVIASILAAAALPWRRVQARRLRRTAAANRDVVYLLMPYPELADVRDRLADVSAIQEDTAAVLSRLPRSSPGPLR